MPRIIVIFASKRIQKVDENIVKSYDKAYYVLPDSEQAGRLQRKMLVNIWNRNKNKNKSDIDTNAKTFYELVMHLVTNTNFDCAKKYKCDETGRIIELPFKEYLG